MRPLYLKALGHFQDLPGPDSFSALDLGCGIGTETLDLLRKGFRVHAFDKEPQVIALLRASAEQTRLTAGLTTQICAIELLQEWPSIDLFYAFHVLPFVPKDYFAQVLSRSIQSVKPGGLYVASFFGAQDDWVVAGTATGISTEEILRNLHQFEVLHFEEVKSLGPSALNGQKRWHIIEVIAKSP